jgi:hypothetical protein
MRHFRRSGDLRDCLAGRLGVEDCGGIEMSDFLHEAEAHLRQIIREQAEEIAQLKRKLAKYEKTNKKPIAFEKRA